jgi:hypothetical protein
MATNAALSMARPTLPIPPQEHQGRGGAARPAAGVAAALIAATNAKGRTKRVTRADRRGMAVRQEMKAGE